MVERSALSPLGIPNIEKANEYISPNVFRSVLSTTLEVLDRVLANLLDIYCFSNVPLFREFMIFSMLLTPYFSTFF